MSDINTSELTPDESQKVSNPLDGLLLMPDQNGNFNELLHVCSVCSHILEAILQDNKSTKGRYVFLKKEWIDYLGYPTEDARQSAKEALQSTRMPKDKYAWDGYFFLSHRSIEIDDIIKAEYQEHGDLPDLLKGFVWSELEGVDARADIRDTFRDYLDDIKTIQRAYYPVVRWRSINETESTKPEGKQQPQKNSGKPKRKTKKGEARIKIIL